MTLFPGSRLLSNAPGAVAAGGAMILLARTQDGFGNAEIERQLYGLSSMAEREAALRTTFSIGGYVGFLFAEAAEKYHLILVTDMAPQRFARTCIHAVPQWTRPWSWPPPSWAKASMCPPRSCPGVRQPCPAWQGSRADGAPAAHDLPCAALCCRAHARRRSAPPWTT